MLRLSFPNKRAARYRILCLGSHCDDIEIGCGGTILRLLKQHRNLVFYWIVFGSTPQRKREALRSADLFLRGAREKHVAVENFRDSFFPYAGQQVKEYFASLARRVSPDLIFTHYRHDLHQDHRVISDLTWNAFRDHLILEYEIPKYDGDLGVPNCFVHLSERLGRQKASYLIRSFKSQKTKPWFTRDTILALLRLRGVESNSNTRYAEAFYARKIVF